jgi:hypothetical protein
MDSHDNGMDMVLFPVIFIDLGDKVIDWEAYCNTYVKKLGINIK